jgi:hypothetical protein
VASGKRATLKDRVLVSSGELTGGFPRRFGGTDSGAPTSARRPRLLSVDEYHRMVEVGIFHEDEHVELLEGWSSR